MKINRHILDNGLRLVHSQDESTQMVALNILYKVGARDEHPEHTGFAHLFEHLMFGGSVNIPDWRVERIMPGRIMILPTITSLFPARMWKPAFGWSQTVC